MAVLKLFLSYFQLKLKRRKHLRRRIVVSHRRYFTMKETGEFHFFLAIQRDHP